MFSIRQKGDFLLLEKVQTIQPNFNIELLNQLKKCFVKIDYNPSSQFLQIAINYKITGYKQLGLILIEIIKWEHIYDT